MGLGLAALFSSEYPEAEAIFKSSKADAASGFVSELNLGMTSYLSAKYEQALEHFTAAGDAPIALFMKVRSLSLLPKRRGSRKEAAEILTNLNKNYFDFNQEAQLLSADLLLESGNKAAAENRVELALDTDPEMTSSHWHEPLLYQNPASWKALVPVCRRLQDSLKTNSSRALLSLCLGKAGLNDEALRTLTEALTVSGEDPVLQSVNALLLFNSARDDGARAALSIATKQAPIPMLAHFVKARLCMRHNDLECAEEEWKALEAGTTQKLAAEVGLAEVHLKRSDAAGAHLYISKAIALSPSYKPALRLQGTALKGTTESSSVTPGPRPDVQPEIQSERQSEKIPGQSADVPAASQPDAKPEASQKSQPSAP